MPPAIFTTEKRNAILTFVRQHISRTGRAPGYNAIGKAVGLTYAPTIARYVLDLIDAGELTRQPHKQGRSMIAVPGKPTPSEQRATILTFMRKFHATHGKLLPTGLSARLPAYATSPPWPTMCTRWWLMGHLQHRAFAWRHENDRLTAPPLPLLPLLGTGEGGVDDTAR